MARSTGDPSITIAIIDGPAGAACAIEESRACQHGSRVVALLSADRGSVVPGICPGCRVAQRPIFPEAPPEAPHGGATWASPSDLAGAIRAAVDDGARIIHLSLAVVAPPGHTDTGLWQVLDHARAKGALVVAAAGNTPDAMRSALVRHPWVLLALPCDLDGKLHGTLPADAATRGRCLRAPGRGVVSFGPGGQLVGFNGSSAAAPFVSGTAALLLSLSPKATAEEVRAALLADNRATGATPPLLDAWGALQRLWTTEESTEITMQDETGDLADKAQSNTMVAPRTAPFPRAAVVPQCDGGCADKAASGPPVYSIGRIQPRFPSVAVEREVAQVVGRTDLTGKTEGQALHSILARPENRYLAREMCWVLSIENIETYLIAPRFPGDVDLLIEAMRSGPRPTDVDVVIGTLGPVASPSYCNGTQLPIVTFDQIWSFDVDALLGSIPRPEGIPAEQFAATAEELFYRILQIADNAGATDEHRALNYLAVRYPAVYTAVAQAHARNRSLQSVSARPSRLSGPRSIVDVVFSFVDRATDVVDKQFARVDVSERYPFLVTKLSPYYDR